VSAARRAVSVVGEVFITAGVLVLLFLVYQLVWTNVQAERAAEEKSDVLIETWEVDGPTGPEFHLPLKPGKAFALMYIPRLGDDYRVPVVQGVELEDLAVGVGHYPETALPGGVGNFAVAGHRATNGEPFAYLDQVRKGDAVVVETGTKWYTYRVTEQYIVEPTQVEVILPVPNEPGVEPKKSLLTLTTCNPRWASYERLIVHGKLIEVLEKGSGRPAALGGDG
jgi:sortase A